MGHRPNQISVYGFIIPGSQLRSILKNLYPTLNVDCELDEVDEAIFDYQQDFETLFPGLPASMTIGYHPISAEADIMSVTDYEWVFGIDLTSSDGDQSDKTFKQQYEKVFLEIVAPTLIRCGVSTDSKPALTEFLQSG